MKIIEALNGISANVWAVFIVSMAAALYLTHHETAGQAFAAGGFMLLQHKSQ